MEIALHANLPKASLLAINHCCIAHQALYWLDVSNGWGNHVSPLMLSPPTSGQKSSWSWPLEHPSKADWAIWAAFLANSPHTILGSLAPLLGPWTHPPHWSDMIPFEASSNTAFYFGHDLYWRILTAQSFWSYQSTQNFTYQGLMVAPPPNTFLACIEHILDQVIFLSGYAPSPVQTSPPSPPWQLKSAHFPSSGGLVAQALQQETMVAICDGLLVHAQLLSSSNGSSIDYPHRP